MIRQARIRQWCQLAVLSSVHFLVDMFGNMLPAILPAFREHFAMRLSLGSVVLAALMLSANGVQLLTGHLRPDKVHPFFLHVGLVLAAAVCLMALVPQSTLGVAVVVALAVVSGCGIAVVHPEGLRGIHALDEIPPAMSTAVFMTAGFLGFASGGRFATMLVDAYGLSGLLPLIGCPVLGVVALAASGVRLSTAKTEAEAAKAAQADNAKHLPFWQVALMGLPAATSTTLVLSLVPTYLNELGFELTFGGDASLVFGVGGAIGPFAWAAAAHRKGDLPCAMWAFALSVPFMLFYVLFGQYRPAIWLLPAVGFCSMSAYILTITLSRHAAGLKFGQRMALVVGGTWGMANIVFLALSPVAERFGTGLVISITPAGYLLSAFLALRLMLKYPGAGRATRSSLVDVVIHEDPPA